MSCSGAHVTCDRIGESLHPSGSRSERKIAAPGGRHTAAAAGAVWASSARKASRIVSIDDAHVTTVQKASAETTSPPDMVAMDHQVTDETESLTKRTEPSIKRRLTPPGWFELAFRMVWSWCPLPSE